MEPDAKAPPVVVVVVTCDPGAWFDEALTSVANQDYPNLSVLVVDAASVVDPTARVRAIVPEAFVRRLPHRVGFGVAANEVLDIVDGASHYLFCHDDVALAPDALRLMVEESFRSNAGIVSPKLLDWDRPQHLLEVGAGADRVGVVHPLVERGELDQEQHDGVRDVFVAPGGATLVRADLFGALRGFDDDIVEHGEDLDFSWRVQIAGARVIVAPAARVRHLEASERGLRVGTSSPAAKRRAVQRAELHRIRTVLACYGIVRLLWIVPVLVVHAVAEASWRLVSGRPGDAAATLVALGGALRHPGRLWRSRRSVQRHRRSSDRDVGALQSSGSARLAAYVRARVSGAQGGVEPTRAELPSDGLEVAAPSMGFERGSVATEGDGAGFDQRMEGRSEGDGSAGAGWRLPLGAGAVLLTLLVIGSRSLVGGAIPAVGSLPSGNGTIGHWWHDWWSTWQSAGLGSNGPGAPGLGLLALLGTGLVGAVGLVQHVVVLGPLVVGPLGAYRAARAWGSARGRVAALVVYATVPVPYDALARGRWAGLVVYGAAPWVLAGIGRLSGAVPFPPTTARSVATRVVGLGVLVAVTASVAPAFVFVVPALGAAILAGSMLSGSGRAGGGGVGVGGVGVGGVDARGVGVGVRCLGVSCAAAVIAAGLLLPWSASVLSSRAATFGVLPPASARLGLGQLLLFHTGPVGNGVLGWGLLAAAALPLAIGRSWRLEWAARLWLVALVCIGATWAGLRGWIPVPDPEVLLAPAAAALAGAVALGAAAFELDLPGYRFGWRQLASGVAAVGLAAAAVPAVQAAGSGRWDLPGSDAGSVLGFLPDAHRGDYRVLWVGAPGALPLRSNYLGEGVAYATSFDGLPDATDQWATRPGGSTGVLGADLRLASGGLTTKLGHLLAPLAVRYIVVPNHLGPSGSGAVAVPTPGQLLQGLGQQTDLQALTEDTSYSIYINAAWAPARAVLAPGVAAALPGTDAGAGAGAGAGGASGAARSLERLDLRGSKPALTGGSDGSRGPLPTPSSLYVASSPAGGWALRVGGRPVAGSDALGGEVFAVPGSPATPSASAVLRAPFSVVDRVGQLAEIVLWLAVAAVLLADRRRRRERPAETVRPEWFTPIAPARPRPRRRGGVTSGFSAGGSDLADEEVWIDV